MLLIEQRPKSSAEGESTLSQSQSQSSNKLGKAVQTMRASQPLLLAVGMGFVAVWTDMLSGMTTGTAITTLGPLACHGYYFFFIDFASASLCGKAALLS